MTNGLIQRELGREAIFLRGLFVYRHSGVDFAVNELLVRCRLLEAYGSIGNLPYPFEKRLRLAEKVLGMPGPLEPYRDELTEALEAYRTYTPHRHLMVHGLMRIPFAGDADQRIMLRAYQHRGRLHQSVIYLSIDDMRELVDQLGSIAGFVPALVGRIISEVQLPEVARLEEQPW